MRVFILDDARSISQAMRDAGVSFQEAEITICRPFQWSFLLNYPQGTLQDAEDMIAINSAYDVWILDNDLGGGLEGFSFLKWACENCPAKVPPTVASCSANPHRRRDIVSYHSDFMRSR